MCIQTGQHAHSPSPPSPPSYLYMHTVAIEHHSRCQHPLSLSQYTHKHHQSPTHLPTHPPPPPPPSQPYSSLPSIPRHLYFSERQDLHTLSAGRDKTRNFIWETWQVSLLTPQNLSLPLSMPPSMPTLHWKSQLILWRNALPDSILTETIGNAPSAETTRLTPSGELNTRHSHIFNLKTMPHTSKPHHQNTPSSYLLPRRSTLPPPPPPSTDLQINSFRA